MSDLKSTTPLTLKCGLTLPNRIVKAAIAENLAGSDYLPNEKHLALYKQWAEGGWGLVLSGNVQVDTMYLGSPTDIAIDSTADPSGILQTWIKYASVASANGTPTLVQLNHPGRQSPLSAGKRGFFAQALAPSAIPLFLGPGLIAQLARAFVFGTPRAMTIAEIETVVAQFASAAKIVAAAGFAGVEIHAAHGYLLTQFLSAKSNVRQDKYGGSAANRARIVVEIVKAIKEAVPKEGFAVGIKLNSVDHQSKEELADCMQQLRLIAGAGVDFIEISGGNYEDPKMFLGTGESEKPQAAVSTRTKAREAFFLEFARTIRSEFKDMPLMVTGGFRSRQGIESAIANDDCDLVGLGRPAVIDPLLPKSTIFNPEVVDQDATLFTKKIDTPWILKQIGIRAVGAGFENRWYEKQIKQLVNLAKQNVW